MLKSKSKDDQVAKTTPTVFISYSWDSAEHKDWVRGLAERLRGAGINVILDQWHSTPGDQLPAFMERSVRESDFVLLVCTPAYKQKSETRSGGSGYEEDVIQGEVFVRGNHRKFIPVLRNSDWSLSAPFQLLGKYYIDLRDGTDYEHNYRELVLTLTGKRELPPELGVFSVDDRPSPDAHITPVADRTRLSPPRNYVFVSDNKVGELFPQIPASYVQSFEGVAQTSNPYFQVGVVSQYIEEFIGVGSIESPKGYFKGVIEGQCLVTDSEVFFGTKLPFAAGGETFRYVALSGSLKHMIDTPFKELAKASHEVMPPLLARLRGAKADYIYLNSNTASFHSYLHRVSRAESMKDRPPKLLERKSLLSRVFEEATESWKEILIGGAVFLIPLGLSILSARFIGAWSWILIILSMLWILVGIAYFLFVYVLAAVLSGSSGEGPLEPVVIDVVDRLSSPTERYEFLARTITVGESKGEPVLLGSPVYVALAPYEPPQV